MKCDFCKNGCEIEDENRHYCSSCYCRFIEKKVRRFGREGKLFRKGDRIAVVGELCRYFVKSMTSGLPAKIFYINKFNKEFAKKNKVNKIVIPWTMDDEAVNFIDSFMSNKKVEKEDLKIVRLLRNVKDDEIAAFCRLKGIKFEKNKKREDIQQLIDDVNKRCAETKFCILKSIGQMKGK